MITPELRIDPATEADIPVILALIRALAEYERMAGECVTDEARVRGSLFGPRAVAQAVIARAAGAPVGFAVWFYNYSTFLGKAGLYLEDLFVVPEWRGRGVGRALLAYLASVALARKCERMEWSVIDWNETAISFYRRLGARPLDEWTIFRLSGDALTNLATQQSTQNPRNSQS
jgi:GNAT superfamily N-acetyltransferase